LTRILGSDKEFHYFIHFPKHIPETNKYDDWSQNFTMLWNRKLSHELFEEAFGL
jgi:hypothetical protein